MVRKLQPILRNNPTLSYPDGKGAEVAMQEKVNDVDEGKRSLSPKLISRVTRTYGEVLSLLAGNRC